MADRECLQDGRAGKQDQQHLPSRGALGGCHHAAGSGLTVDYANTGALPVIQSNVDLNNPANFGWNAGSRVNIQDEKRDTDTKGARTNFTWGKGKDVNLQFGASYDDILRQIRGYDNSQAWQNAVCGNNPSVFVPTPNLQPPCSGQVQPANPGLSPLSGLSRVRDGYTAGQSTAVTYQGSRSPMARSPLT